MLAKYRRTGKIILTNASAFKFLHQYQLKENKNIHNVQFVLEYVHYIE